MCSPHMPAHSAVPTPALPMNSTRSADSCASALNFWERMSRTIAKNCFQVGVVRTGVSGRRSLKSAAGEFAMAREAGRVRFDSALLFQFFLELPFREFPVAGFERFPNQLALDSEDRIIGSELVGVVAQLVERLVRKELKPKDLRRTGGTCADFPKENAISTFEGKTWGDSNDTDFSPRV